MDVDDFEKKEPDTRGKKRLLLLGYLLVGAVVGLSRSWSLNESVYFTVATLTTVGYGDYSFKGMNSLAQIAGAFFVVSG